MQVKVIYEDYDTPYGHVEGYQGDSFTIIHPDGLPNDDVFRLCTDSSCELQQISTLLIQIHLDPTDVWEPFANEAVTAHQINHYFVDGCWMVSDGVCACNHYGIEDNLYESLRDDIKSFADDTFTDRLPHTVEADFDINWDSSDDWWDATVVGVYRCADGTAPQWR